MEDVRYYNLITLRQRLLDPQPSLVPKPSSVPARSANGAGAPRWRDGRHVRVAVMFVFGKHVRILENVDSESCECWLWQMLTLDRPKINRPSGKFKNIENSLL